MLLSASSFPFISFSESEPGFCLQLGAGPSSVTPGILPTPMGPVPPGMYPGQMQMNHMMPPFMQHR